MICPNCEMEYVKGIKVCADCNIDLIPLEEFEGNLTKLSDWKIVYTTDADYEAEMLKTNLESSGMEVKILGQKDRNLPGVGDLSVIKILVLKKDVDDAVAIINDINSRETTGDDEAE